MCDYRCVYYFVYYDRRQTDFRVDVCVFRTARQWLWDTMGKDMRVTEKHMAACASESSAERVKAFGIPRVTWRGLFWSMDFTFYQIFLLQFICWCIRYILPVGVYRYILSVGIYCIYHL